MVATIFGPSEVRRLPLGFAVATLYFPTIQLYQSKYFLKSSVMFHLCAVLLVKIEFLCR